ncbi:MAG TPA: hypothetical protein P5250_07330, partial [Bacteroidales bacterium]|nr:hypothetical protein [Bacteroidales bacterium]
NGKEQIIFVSSRLSTKLINHSDGWTGYYYNNLFVTEKKSNGKYKRVKLFSRKIQSYLNNGPVSFSSDMKKVYFTRNAMFNNKAQRSEDGKAKLQICQADYYNKKKTFDNVVEFAYNDYNYNFAYPVISSDGKYLYFASDCPGGYGGMDIWMCEWEGDRWGYPVNLGEKVNSAGNEIFPYIYGSDKLYFSSDGRGGLGGLDIFVTNINSLNGQPINNADNVGANINSLYDDFGIVFRADGKSGFVSSNRSSNDDNIYEFVIQNSF